MYKKHISRVRKRRLARFMRLYPTEPEAVLWEAIKYRRLGFNYRRQAIVAGYILDFYCDILGLDIELDGRSHEKHKRYDAKRTRVLNALDIIVIRFKNSEILLNHEEVIERIKKAQDVISITRKG